MTWWTKKIIKKKKKCKISNTEIFIFFALNQLNMLIYSKTEFLQKYKNR